MAHSIINTLTRLPRGTSSLLASAVGLLVLLWPRRTTKLDYITTGQRDQYFGPIQYVPAPTETEAEKIFITNNFYAKNIIRRWFPLIGYAAIHRLAIPSLEAALTEIERKGYGQYVKTFEGGYNARFVRGSTSNLSSHAYGTSIDINAGSNPLGGTPTVEQEKLAPIFEKHGWYWGNRFSRPDPMHFEYVVPPKGAMA